MNSESSKIVVDKIISKKLLSTDVFEFNDKKKQAELLRRNKKLLKIDSKSIAVRNSKAEKVNNKRSDNLKTIKE